MRVEVDPIIGTTGAWAEGVQRGNLILEKMLGDFKDQTTARWTVEKDESRLPRLMLELACDEGSARASFSERDVANGREFWRQLNEVWSNTLGDANRKGLKRINQLVNQLLEEEAVADHAS
jgi:hypothetical protein